MAPRDKITAPFTYRWCCLVLYIGIEVRLSGNLLTGSPEPKVKTHASILAGPHSALSQCGFSARAFQLSGLCRFPLFSR